MKIPTMFKSYKIPTMFKGKEIPTMFKSREEPTMFNDYLMTYLPEFWPCIKNVSPYLIASM